MDNTFQMVGELMIRFSLMALMIERALYVVFDGKSWKFLESKLPWSDAVDLKRPISLATCIFVVFTFKYDIYAELFSRPESDPTLILTGMFLAGGTTGVFKFLKRARQLKDMQISK